MTGYWAWVVFERAIRDYTEAAALAEGLHDGYRGITVDMNPHQPLMVINTYGDPFGPVDDPDATPLGPLGVLAVAVGSESWREVDEFLRKAVASALPGNPIRRVVVRRLRRTPAEPIVPPV